MVRRSPMLGRAVDADRIGCRGADASTDFGSVGNWTRATTIPVAPRTSGLTP